MAEGLPIVVTFTGFKAGSHARAIHEYLRLNASSPRTLEEIVSATAEVGEALKNPKSNAQGHLHYWTKRQLYVVSNGGWMINPQGVQFDPREFAD